MSATLLDIADAAPVGIMAFCQQGIVRFANPALCKIFGYAAAELIGQPVEKLLPESKHAIHPMHRKNVPENPSAPGLGERHNLLGRHAQGWPVAVEIELGRTGDGDAALSIAVINEISHKKAADERFSTIVGALPAGLVLIGPDGCIQLTNPALDKMFGYQSGELIGLPVDILIPVARRAERSEQRKEFFRTPDKLPMGIVRDLIALHSSGREFPVEGSLTPIVHAGQLCSLAVITDISARKQLEQALAQANVILDEFTYIASHDLRSPLRGISDLIEWIEEDLDSRTMSAAVIRNFERVKQRLSKTEQMIEDLLIYSRSSKHDPRMEITSPKLLVSELMEFVQAPPGFSIEAEAPDLVFETCKTPLLAGLRNLLDNALKHHSGERGLIRVSAREEGRFFVFSVDDDGIGVPENAREKVFKLFQRASGATDGHGVGLSVTRRMITSHGGRLILEKLSPLGGACFTIHWPRYGMRDVI